MNLETQRKARLWLGLVFLVGGAIGGVFGYGVGHRSFAAMTATAPALNETERRARRVAEMSKELDLTAEQGAKVDKIIHDAHQEIKAIHEKSDAEADTVRQKVRGEIREFLTGQQKVKFEAMVQRLDAERKQQGR